MLTERTKTHELEAIEHEGTTVRERSRLVGAYQP